MRKIKNIEKSWMKFIEHLNKMKRMINGTSNITGDYAEFLVSKLYNAKKMPNSNKGYDLITSDGKRIQVKSRFVSSGHKSKPLNIIRSWDFEFLVVVLFNEDGSLYQVVEKDVGKAKELSDANDYQNGGIVRTTKDFLSGIDITDKTEEMKRIVNEN